MDWQTEVRDLHDFFAGWFSGTEPADAIERLEVALHPAFTIVGTDGAVTDRLSIVSAVAAGHGLGPTEIEVVDLCDLFVSDRVVVGRYDEWQRHTRDSAPTTNGRRSTAVFVRSLAAPNGVAWLTVHETALGAESEAPRFTGG